MLDGRSEGAGAGGGGYEDRAPARNVGAKAKGGKGPSEDFSRPDFDDEIPF
jgi:hypothetical protein